MGMASDAGTAERLDALRVRVADWRRTRSKPGPMPGVLWEEAAGLARELGISAVSRAAGLGYESLRQHTRRLERAPLVVAASAPRGIGGFVEMRGEQLLGAATSGGGGPVVELTAPDGTHLSIRLPAGSALDVAGLVGTFRGGRR